MNGAPTAPDGPELREIERELGAQYQLVRLLGRGAFGAVYLARDRVLHRLVAIKILHGERAASDTERERFLREARTAAQLDHPGIVPVLAFGRTTTAVYMVMPYAAGESLADRLRREARLPADEVRHVLAEIAAALVYAHRRGVVHRDLKPENVLLGSSGEGRAGERMRVRLVDFGVAAFPMRDMGAGVEREHWGTPDFMSPEQALGEIDLDGRTDLYALGVLGYLMLAGRLPFEGRSLGEHLDRRRTGPSLSLARAAPTAPADLVAAIERCLAYEPEGRWRHAHELCAALTAGDDAPRRPLRRAIRALGALRARRRHAPRAVLFRPPPIRAAVAIDALRDDLRYAVRALARSPAIVLSAVLSFALGIGANATMFGVIDRLLLRGPAHVSEPERVVELTARWRFEGREVDNNSFSYPAFKAMREQIRGAEHVAMMTFPIDVPYGRGERAESLKGHLVSASFFPTLGVRPALGRFILPEEDVEPVGAPVVVISHGLWRRTFGGARTVLGRSLDLGAQRYTVVGVAPKGFTGVGLSAVDIWLPVSAAEGLRFPGAGWATERRSTWMRIFARLRPGVSPARVAAEATAAHNTVAQPALLRLGARVTADPLLAAIRSQPGSGSGVTTLLAGVSGFVLLIACANVANLLLARGLRRRREIAVRLALGVSRTRLVGQLIAESLLLALLGGAAAIAVARWGGEVVRALLLSDITWTDSPVDGRVLAFTVVVALVTGVFTGIVPALQTSRPDLTAALKAGAREGSGQRSRTRTALLVMQAALSVILLVGTGLFVRSLRNVSTLPLGMQPERVLFGTMYLETIGMPPAEIDALFGRMAERVRALPGVRSAAVAVTAPFYSSYGVPVRIPGRDSLPRARGGGTYRNAVGPGFFETLGTRILRGRPFTDADRATSPRVVVINETMARLWFPGESPIGRCLKIGVNPDTVPCAEIVGVAENAKRQNLTEDELLFLYTPLTQAPPEMRARVLVARPSGDDPTRMIGPMRRAMQTAAPNLPYAQVRPLSELFADELRPWRLGAGMFGAFGALALALAAVGLYSVISYSVAQRTHELGVRIALGAQVRDIARLVLGQGLAVAAVGGAIGLITALAAGRFVRPLLFEVSPSDPTVFLLVSVALLLVAAAASLVPAWRATRVDPVAALRAE